MGTIDTAICYKSSGGAIVYEDLDTIDTITVYYNDSKGNIIAEDLDAVKYNDTVIWSSGNYAVTMGSMSKEGNVFLRVHSNKKKTITITYNAAYIKNTKSGERLLKESGTTTISADEFEEPQNPKYSDKPYSRSFKAFSGLKGYLKLKPRISVKKDSLITVNDYQQVGIAVASPEGIASVTYTGSELYGAKDSPKISTEDGGDGVAKYYSMKNNKTAINVGSYTTTCTLNAGFQNLYWEKQEGSSSEDCRTDATRVFEIKKKILLDHINVAGGKQKIYVKAFLSEAYSSNLTFTITSLFIGSTEVKQGVGKTLTVKAGNTEGVLLSIDVSKDHTGKDGTCEATCTNPNIG